MKKGLVLLILDVNLGWISEGFKVVGYIKKLSEICNFCISGMSYLLYKYYIYLNKAISTVSKSCQRNFRKRCALVAGLTVVQEVRSQCNLTFGLCQADNKLKSKKCVCK